MDPMRWRGRRLNLQRMRRAKLPTESSVRLGRWWEWGSDEATRRVDALMARIRAAYPAARTVEFRVVESMDRMDSRLAWTVRY